MNTDWYTPPTVARIAQTGERVLVADPSSTYWGKTGNIVRRDQADSNQILVHLIEEDFTPQVWFNANMLVMQ